MSMAVRPVLGFWSVAGLNTGLVQATTLRVM